MQAITLRLWYVTQHLRREFAEADTQAELFILLYGWSFSYGLIRGLQSQRRLLWFLGIVQAMSKVVFCKDGNHKAGEHGVFENSYANKPHKHMNLIATATGICHQNSFRITPNFLETKCPSKVNRTPKSLNIPSGLTLTYLILFISLSLSLSFLLIV